MRNNKEKMTINQEELKNIKNNLTKQLDIDHNKLNQYTEVFSTSIADIDIDKVLLTHMNSTPYFPKNDFFRKIEEKRNKRIHEEKMNKILGDF